jgi:copper chaperone NosL
MSMAALAVGMLACTGAPAPREIAWGQDQCDHCHMTIVDRRFAAAVVTRTGRTYVFDDAGCMARFVEDGAVPAAEIHSLWVSDVAAPDGLRELGSMRLLRADTLRTPMASHLAATRPERAESVAAALGGVTLRTRDVLTARDPAP